MQIDIHHYIHSDAAGERDALAVAVAQRVLAEIRPFIQQ